MNYVVLVGKKAFIDIQNAVNYYEKQLVGLSHSFVEDFEKCVNTLEQNPKFQISYDDIRCLPMKKFPYNIHFRIDDKQKLVKIEAVFNTHQNPNKKPK